MSLRKDLRKRKILSLLVLIFVEIALGVYTFHISKPAIPQAYLVKNGNSYLLVWKNGNRETFAKHYSYLHEALHYAHDELELKLGPNPNSNASIQTVWTRDDVGKRMVYWITNDIPSPNRLTFRRTYEADVFKAALSSGAYSPSPFGHSLSLIPRR